MMSVRIHPLFLLLFLLLSACTTPEPNGTVVFSGTEASVEENESVPEFVSGDDPFSRARALADILYDAKIAYEDNRLMSPNGNNAYDRYQLVLQYDPGNAVALEGIQEIVLRYIELADNAIALAELDEAELMLSRATRLNPDRPELKEARQRLDALKLNRIEEFALDPSGLRDQSLVMMTELADIADYIRKREARFLINARTDAEARWIYKVMRESVGGYRLRGNVGIAAEPVILVTIPN